MNNFGRYIRLALAAFAVLLSVSSGPTDAAAGGGGITGGDPLNRHRELLGSLILKSSGEAPRVHLSDDGYILFLGAPAGNAFAGGGKSGDAQAAAEAFMKRRRGNFMSTSPDLTLTVSRVKDDVGRSYVRFTQEYAGLRVYGAEVVVQVASNGGIEMANVDVMRETGALDKGKLLLAPTLNASDATEAGYDLIAPLHPEVGLSATDPELVIYDPSILDETGKTALVWLFELLSDEPGVVHERVFVDAHSAKVLLHYTLIHEAKNRQIYDSNNTSANPGTLMRSEGGPVSGITDVNVAYDYFGDTYDFYFGQHGRDSIDGSGYTLSATVRYCDPFDFCPMPNAFWDGSRMYFGAGFAAADDVVSHELTHGVTQYESNLDYVNQSGAINESFSDMWGEWVDLSNSGGTDTPAVRWLMGEDVPGFGAIRDMENPPTFGDPDRMGSPLFYTGSGDNGGVHINSGVGNKLCYLLTDGGSFNNRTISSFGIPLTADLFYECQTNLLTSTSNYAGLYNALTQAAINLSLTQPQKDNIEQACLAVEIKPLPAGVSNFAAVSNAGNTNIALSWTNPVGGGFQNVVIRRSTVSYPLDATSGTLVYQGSGTSTVDTGLVQDQLYYYSAFAFYGGSSYSYAKYAEAIAGQDPPSYFTEQFGSDNDMDNVMFELTPDGSPSFYRMCGFVAFGYPSADAGTLLSVSDDGSQQVSLTGGAQVSLYGVQYSSFYVNGNGNITFVGPSGTYTESLSDHFGVPRISALFDDLNPSGGGTVRSNQLADRVVVTYNNVPEYGTSNSNNFQIEMFFNGTIRVTYLGVAAPDGIVGVSEGVGTPDDFTESNMNRWDNDGDLLPNCWEVDHGLNPNSSSGNDGGSGDPDGDGRTNSQEFAAGLDPMDSDTDDDLLDDGDEYTAGTNPLLADSDGDGFLDGEEVNAGTNPLNNMNYPTTLLWADFAYAGTETGAFSLPYNTVAEAINTVTVGGIVRIKGNTADPTTAEAIRITKQVRVEASGGTVRIGI